VDIAVPEAITVFTGELDRPPRSRAEQVYRNLNSFHEVDKGGHFAAWDEPEFLADAIRAAFRARRPAH
jgi:pimeloyl-ACP methyl ester carboxylesterase